MDIFSQNDMAELHAVQTRLETGTDKPNDMKKAVAKCLYILMNLDTIIEKAHDDKCANCPARLAATAPVPVSTDGDEEKKTNPIVSLLSNNMLPWIIVGICLLIIASLVGVDVSPIINHAQ